MATSRTGSSVIQFDEHQDDKSELQFQDFGHGDAATLETSDYGSGFPDSPNLENENAGLLSDEKKPSSFWEFAYYQSFFDVDTDQVIQRIIWSMIPVRSRATYLDRVIRPTPDLYGPFWISTTLIFSTAISANIAEYFMTEGQDKRIWHYDFRKVSFAATAIYSYAFLLPLALWCLMWYRQSSTRYTLLEIVCVYGYSLFMYIPISVLWLIQVSWLQWTLVIIGAALSGLVLAHTFWPTVQDENKKVAVVALCLILLFHALLAVGFVTFFFRPPHTTRSLPETMLSPEITTPATNIQPDKLQTVVNKDAVVKNSGSIPQNSVIKTRETNGFSAVPMISSIENSATLLSNESGIAVTQNSNSKNDTVALHSEFDNKRKGALHSVPLVKQKANEVISNVVPKRTSGSDLSKSHI